MFSRRLRFSFYAHHTPRFRSFVDSLPLPLTRLCFTSYTRSISRTAVRASRMRAASRYETNTGLVYKPRRVIENIPCVVPVDIAQRNCKWAAPFLCISSPCTVDTCLQGKVEIETRECEWKEKYWKYFKNFISYKLLCKKHVARQIVS